MHHCKHNFVYVYMCMCFIVSMLSEPLVKVIRYVVEPTYDILSCNLITKSTNFPRNINQQYPLCWIEYYKLSPPHCYVVKYFDFIQCVISYFQELMYVFIVVYETVRLELMEWLQWPMPFLTASKLRSFGEIYLHSYIKGILWEL